MKTTLDIPDDLFRELKATAALRGQSMKELITQAVKKELAGQKKPVPSRSDYAKRLEALAQRVSAASPGTASLSDELREMRDR
jgi:hypothetical protein